MSGDGVLRVEGLVKHFTRRGSPPVRAVDGVTLAIGAGETVAVVGESGCGKSTLVRAVARLVEPTAGRVLLEGRDLTRARGRELRRARRELQVVFQDPSRSLNPRRAVGAIVAEPLRIHRRYRAEGGARRVGELLETVGLDPATAARRPADLSGGQRQRVGIARALALRPRLLLLDEPVSSLDASVRAGVVNLLEDLQGELGLAYLFVTHDLSLVRHLADRVHVMYLGRVVERGGVRDVYERSLHPYTRALLSAVPSPDPEHRALAGRVVLRGEVPDAARPPSGCSFHPRCPCAREGCADESPLLLDRERDHACACREVPIRGPAPPTTAGGRAPR